MFQLTAEIKEKYLKYPNSCPFCGSNRIEAVEQPQLDDTSMSQEVHCYNCGAMWYDIYSLSDIQLVE